MQNIVFERQLNAYFLPEFKLLVFLRGLFEDGAL